MWKPKRVLLVGAHFGAEVEMQAYVHSALTELGCEVRPFDYQATRSVPHWLKRWIPRSIKSLLSPRRFKVTEKVEANLVDKDFIKACADFEPDLVFFLRGERVSGEAIQAVKQEGRKIINWISDEPRFWLEAEQRESFDPAFDVWFVADPEYGEQLSNPRRVEILSMACDPKVHRPVELTDADRKQWGSRLVFVGGHAGEREPVLNAVADLGLSIWGPRWDRTEDPKVKACVRESRQMLPEEWGKIYAAADIVINIHRRFAYVGPNMKCFEALACGAYLVSDQKPFVERLFEGRVQTFGSPEELRAICETMLKDPEGRARDREALRALVLDKHTYRKRIETIFQSLELLDRDPTE